MRAAALILEVKGDFCHDIRQILVEAGRGQDYIELGMDSPSQWNPLSAWWLDSYSLAYTVSSLLNQLFGKGKEPFWQQAYTNLVRWIIELHRVFPDRWVTLQQVYRCAIDPELFASKIEAAEKLSDDLNTGTVFIKTATLDAQLEPLGTWQWTRTAGGQTEQAPYTRPLKAKLDELKIEHEIAWEHGPGEDTRERVEAIKRWFVHDWQNLDNKIKSSIVEGVSVFLSMFDMPDVAKVFCPAAPAITDDPQAIILQAQIKRLQAKKDAAAEKAGAAEAKPEAKAEPEPGRQAPPGGGDQIHMGRGAEGAEEAKDREKADDGEGSGTGAAESGATAAGQGGGAGTSAGGGGGTSASGGSAVASGGAGTSEARRSAVGRDGAGRQDAGPRTRHQPSPCRRYSPDHPPPTADLSIDRAGQGAGLEYARWYQPGAIPRRGRDAQERLATSASHASGPDEGESGQLLSARRLYL